VSRDSLRVSLLCGIAILLILGFLLLDNNTPIVLSKNALFRVNKPEEVMRLSGQLTHAGGDTFYHYHKGILYSLNSAEEILWKKRLNGETLLWMGPEGILTAYKNTLKLWDSDDNLSFERNDLLQDMRVLSVRGDYWLISGKLDGKEHVALINSGGSILWYTPLTEGLISADVTSSAIYAAINLINDKLSGKLVLINSAGSYLWEKSYPTMLLQVKLLDFGVAVIAEDKVFAVDYEGNALWEYAYKGPILRGDIGDDGYTAVVVKESSGNLNVKEDFKIIMISREGKNLWTFSLESRGEQVRRGKEVVYIVDESGILVLSREGLLISKLALKGVRDIEETPFGDLIAVGEKVSSLIKLSHGR